MDSAIQPTAVIGLSARLADALAAGRELTVYFRHPREIPDIAHIFSRPSMEPDRVSLGLAELMMNAIEHGILGIDSAEKQALLQEDRLHGEIIRRLEIPPWRESVATLSLTAVADELQYLVRDPGPGFDHVQILRHVPQRPQDLVGRGIAIARRVGFAGVEYLGKGNIVRALAAKRPDWPGVGEDIINRPII